MSIFERPVPHKNINWLPAWKMIKDFLMVHFNVVVLLSQNSCSISELLGTNGFIYSIVQKAG